MASKGQPSINSVCGSRTFQKYRINSMRPPRRGWTFFALRLATSLAKRFSISGSSDGSNGSEEFNEFIIRHVAKRSVLDVEFLRQDRGDHLEVLVRLLGPHSLNDASPVLLEVLVHRIDESLAQLVAAALWAPRVAGLKRFEVCQRASTASWFSHDTISLVREPSSKPSPALSNNHLWARIIQPTFSKALLSHAAWRPLTKHCCGLTDCSLFNSACAWSRRSGLSLHATTKADVGSVPRPST